jgi:hypothetical protein
VFDKKEFVESVIKRDLSLDEIIIEARDESARAESGSDDVEGAAESGTAESGAEESIEYVQFLSSLGFFLRGGTMPAGISDDDFQLLHHLTKYLVELGNFKPAILALFAAAPDNG